MTCTFPGECSLVDGTQCCHTVLLFDTQTSHMWIDYSCKLMLRLTQRRLAMHEVCHRLLSFCVSLAEAHRGELLICLPQSHVTLQQTQHGSS